MLLVVNLIKLHPWHTQRSACDKDLLEHGALCKFFCHFSNGND